MKKKMGYLQVILMIGCIPMLATMVALTVYASGKMKDELVDSTYLRLKACATSVERISHGISVRIFWKRMISVISL